MKSQFLIAAALISSVWLAAAPARAQEVTKENVDGITNFHRLETTVACSGAIKATAVPGNQEVWFRFNHQFAAAERRRREPSGRRSSRQGRRHSLLFHPLQQHRARSCRGRQVSGRHHDKRQRARVHSLRRWRARGHHVVHQADGCGPLGRGSRGEGSDGVRDDQRGTEAIRN